MKIRFFPAHPLLLFFDQTVTSVCTRIRSSEVLETGMRLNQQLPERNANVYPMFIFDSTTAPIRRDEG